MIFAATSRAVSLFLSKFTESSATFLLRSTDVIALLLAVIEVNEGRPDTSMDESALLEIERVLTRGKEVNVRDFSIPLLAYTLVNDGRFERLKLVIGLLVVVMSLSTG